MTPRPPREGPGPSPVQRILVFGLRWMRAALHQISQGRIPSAVGITVGGVWLLVALILFWSAVVDVARGGDDGSVLLVLAALVGMAGLVTARMCHFPRRVTLPQLFGSVLGGTLAAVVAVMAAHVATGATSAVDVALVEAAATVTGTNASTLDPSALSDGMLMFRAAGQWAAGASLIVTVVRVLPHLGVGGLDADGGVATRSARRLSPRTGATMGRLLLLYSGLTGLVAIAYFAAGMPFLDSGMHALTTMSTGGFSTRATSIGDYGSAAIEWVAIVGMTCGGTSLPLMFLAARRKDPRRFARSFEFRLYLTLMVFVAFSIVAWSEAQLSAEGVRRALFAASAAVSTTGYVADDLSQVPSGGVALLMTLMIVGGMSASVAGGFKVVRFLALASYINRELRRAVHPTATETVRLGRSSIGEVALSRIVGELIAAMLVLVPAVLLLSRGGLDVEGAFTFAVSALSNVGVAFGSAAPLGHLAALDPLGRTTAALVMIMGRIGLLPVMVSVMVVAQPLFRGVRVRRLRGREVVHR